MCLRKIIIILFSLIIAPNMTHKGPFVDKPVLGPEFSVTLNPMEIRTFEFRADMNL